SFHLAKGKRTRQKARQQVNDLPGSGRDHLVHAIRHDDAGPSENSFGVGPTSDEPRYTAGLVDGDLLVVLQRVLVATDLRNHRVAQSQSLVAMLLHIFD